MKQHNKLMQNYSCNFHKHTSYKQHAKIFMTNNSKWNSAHNRSTQQRNIMPSLKQRSLFAKNITHGCCHYFQLAGLRATPLSFSNRTLLHIMYLVWLIFQRVPHHHRGFPLCRGSHFSSGCWGQRRFFQVATCSGFPFLRRLPLAEGSHFQEGCHLQRAPIFHRVATSRGISFFTGLPPAEGSHFLQSATLQMFPFFLEGSHFATVPIFKMSHFAEGSHFCRALHKLSANRPSPSAPTTSNYSYTTQFAPTTSNYSCTIQSAPTTSNCSCTKGCIDNIKLQLCNTLHQQHQTTAAQQTAPTTSKLQLHNTATLCTNNTEL